MYSMLISIVFLGPSKAQAGSTLKRMVHLYLIINLVSSLQNIEIQGIKNVYTTSAICK